MTDAHVTETPSAHATPSAASEHSTRTVRCLLYSSDASTREQVMLALGQRPSHSVEITEWFECATSDAVVAAMQERLFDVLILDGEAQPYGGLGLCRQLKHEIFNCPPVLVLTGRPQDAWLATWSHADGAVSLPVDPFVITSSFLNLVKQAEPTASPS